MEIRPDRWMHYLDSSKTAGEKLDGNYTRMLRAILKKSWRQHPKRHQLYGHLPPITKNVRVRRTRHAGHCWRSRDELIRDVLLWTPRYGRAKTGRPAQTYIQQRCEETGCSPEDLPEAIGRSGKRGSVISVLAERHDNDDYGDDEMYFPNNEKRKKTNGGKNRTTKSRNIRTLGENLQIIVNIRSGQYQINRDERSN